MWALPYATGRSNRLRVSSTDGSGLNEVGGASQSISRLSRLMKYQRRHQRVVQRLLRGNGIVGLRALGYGVPAPGCYLVMASDRYKIGCVVSLDLDDIPCSQWLMV